MKDSLLTVLVAGVALGIAMFLMNIDFHLAQMVERTFNSAPRIWASLGLDVVFLLTLATSVWLIGFRLNPPVYVSLLLFLFALLMALVGPLIMAGPQFISGYLSSAVGGLSPEFVRPLHSWLTLQTLAIAGASVAALIRSLRNNATR